MLFLQLIPSENKATNITKFQNITAFFFVKKSDFQHLFFEYL